VSRPLKPRWANVAGSLTRAFSTPPRSVLVCALFSPFIHGGTEFLTYFPSPWGLRDKLFPFFCPCAFFSRGSFQWVTPFAPFPCVFDRTQLFIDLRIPVSLRTPSRPLLFRVHLVRCRLSHIHGGQARAVATRPHPPSCRGHRLPPFYKQMMMGRPGCLSWTTPGLDTYCPRTFFHERLETTTLFGIVFQPAICFVVVCCSPPPPALSRSLYHNSRKLSPSSPIFDASVHESCARLCLVNEALVPLPRMSSITINSYRLYVLSPPHSVQFQ